MNLIGFEVDFGAAMFLFSHIMRLREPVFCGSTTSAGIMVLTHSNLQPANK